MVLRGEEVPIDCYSVRDRSWGPRPQGRPDVGRLQREAGSQAGSFGGVGYSFCAAGPGEAWLIYAVPGPEVEPVTCGFLLRGGEYGHILAGERRVTFDPHTGGRWPSRSRRWTSSTAGCQSAGTSLSRHWRGHGGDSLVHWRWDGGGEGLGEDQSYFSRAQWEANRRRAPGTRA